MIRVLKRDGSISYGFRNPDGSLFELPQDEDDEPRSRSAPVEQVAPLTGSATASGNVREFLRQIGRKGGLARAARHSGEEIAAWGRLRKKTKRAV